MMGSVTGGGDYERDSIAEIEAIPEQGYRFLQWNDSYTESVFTFANNINTPEGGTHLEGFFPYTG